MKAEKPKLFLARSDNDLVLCDENELLNSYPMGIESAVNMAEYVYEQCRGFNIFPDVENLSPEIIDTFNEKLQSLVSEGFHEMVKNGELEQYVGEDGEFYWQLTEKGKQIYEV